jgi:hypothetical protein
VSTYFPQLVDSTKRANIIGFFSRIMCSVPHTHWMLRGSNCTLMYDLEMICEFVKVSLHWLIWLSASHLPWALTNALVRLSRISRNCLFDGFDSLGIFVV